MSLIEENYQDEQGNWLPEAQEILAKATATQTTNNGTHALLPLEEAGGADGNLADQHAHGRRHSLPEMRRRVHPHGMGQHRPACGAARHHLHGTGL
jgi:hypothetical protein